MGKHIICHLGISQQCQMLGVSPQSSPTLIDHGEVWSHSQKANALTTKSHI